jgi:hypothetical protein
MLDSQLQSLFTFYGVFLITSGITAVVFIGMKAKTALASGGTAGIISILTGWLISSHSQSARYVAILLPIALFVVFSWRSAKTLFRIFELIPSSDPDLRGKGFAFLIISLMAVVSLVVFLLAMLLIANASPI